MKQKWYLSALVFILVLFGYSRQKTSVPNQEIVLQFVDAHVTSDLAQNTLAVVKKQLRTLGISNMKVQETAAGRLKITYYSERDVESIKRLFSKEINLEFGYSSLDPAENGADDRFPSNESSNSYNLDVTEIQNSYDAESDLNGCILELATANDSLHKLIVDLSAATNNQREKNKTERVAYLIQRKIALAIHNPSRIIPEVRAGPTSNKNS